MDATRQFRGIVGTALTWGIALAALATGSLALGLATGLVPDAFFGARELVAVTVRGLLAGSVAGGVFAYLVARRERGHTLATLSGRRVALWGAVAAGSVPLLLAIAATGPVLPLGVLVGSTVGFGVIGSVLSTATLRLARRADAQLSGPRDDPQRLRP